MLLYASCAAHWGYSINSQLSQHIIVRTIPKHQNGKSITYVRLTVKWKDYPNVNDSTSRQKPADVQGSSRSFFFRCRSILTESAVSWSPTIFFHYFNSLRSSLFLTFFHLTETLNLLGFLWPPTLMLPAEFRSPNWFFFFRILMGRPSIVGSSHSGKYIARMPTTFVTLEKIEHREWIDCGEYNRPFHGICMDPPHKVVQDWCTCFIFRYQTLTYYDVVQKKCSFYNKDFFSQVFAFSFSLFVRLFEQKQKHECINASTGWHLAGKRRFITPTDCRRSPGYGLAFMACGFHTLLMLVTMS